MKNYQKLMFYLMYPGVEEKLNDKFTFEAYSLFLKLNVSYYNIIHPFPFFKFDINDFKLTK